MNRLLILAALAASAAAHAATPISLLLPVTYIEDEKILHKTKEACKLDERMTSDLVAEFQRRDHRPGTTTSPAGPTLRVQIVGSRGIGGGGWTGSKSLTVQAELLNDGTSIRNKRITLKSRGGLAGPFEGTCGILEGISGDLAKAIVDWSGTTTDDAFDAEAARVAAASTRAAAAEAPASSASNPQ